MDVKKYNEINKEYMILSNRFMNNENMSEEDLNRMIVLEDIINNRYN